MNYKILKEKTRGTFYEKTYYQKTAKKETDFRKTHLLLISCSVIVCHMAWLIYGKQKNRQRH